MVTAEPVRLVFGGAFADSDARGDMDAFGGGGRGSQQGLYFRDSRHLSRWRLQVDGQTWERLDATAVEYDRALFTLGGSPAPGTSGAGIDAVLVRQRRLGSGMREHLTLINHAPAARGLRVRLSFEVDFADLIEARDGVVIDRAIGCEVAGDRVRFDYRIGRFHRVTTLRAPGAELTRNSATYRVQLPAGGRWEADIDVEMVAEAEGRCAAGAR
jgi:N-terminal domain of (some) glycogen debranching enzymes